MNELNKFRVLLVGDNHLDGIKILKEKTELIEISYEDFEDFLNDEQSQKIQAIILRTYTELKKEQLDKLPNLKYIVSCSVGINNLDMEEIKEKQIKLIHHPGSNSNSVAEHTLHFILGLLRLTKPPFDELKGKTVGIIGLGYIGKLVAQKLIGFECNTIAFDVIQQDKNLLDKLKVKIHDFDYVIENSDILTIHVPLNKHTENLINNDVFNKMKDKVYFVNTSRDKVVDTKSLIKNIENNKFSGVALDVYDDDFENALIQLKKSGRNIIMSDHTAAQGKESFRNMCLLPIKEFLEEIEKE